MWASVWWVKSVLSHTVFARHSCWPNGELYVSFILLKLQFHSPLAFLLSQGHAEEKYWYFSLIPFVHLAEISNEIASIVVTPFLPPALEEPQLTRQHLISALQWQRAQGSLKVPLPSSGGHLDQGGAESLPGLWPPTLVPWGNHLHLSASASMEPFHDFHWKKKSKTWLPYKRCPELTFQVT